MFKSVVDLIINDPAAGLLVIIIPWCIIMIFGLLLVYQGIEQIFEDRAERKRLFSNKRKD